MLDKVPLEQAHHVERDDGSFSVSEGSDVAARSDVSNTELSPSLAKEETKLVRLLRACVLSVLFVTAAGVSFAVYRYTSQQEQKEFRDAFDNHARNVIESLKVATERQLMAVDKFATDATATAKNMNATWPFVTLPDFSLRARNTLSELKAVSILINPVVHQKDRVEWNKYIAEHHAGWKGEDLAKQQAGWYNKKINPRYNSTRRNLQGAAEEYKIVNVSKGYGDDIYEWVFTESGEFLLAAVPEDGAFYVPLWQNAPATPLVTENMDGLNNFFNREAYMAVLNEQKAVTGGSFNIEMETPGSEGNQDLDEMDFGNLLVEYLLGAWGREGEMDPLGYFFYPIHEELDYSSNVVAIIVMYVHWRRLFVDILPQDAVGIVAILENTCAQQLTYEINGRDVTYVGKQDLHDPAYDSFVHSIEMTEDFNSNISPLYFGVPLSANAGCQYTLRVYPSKNLEDRFLTRDPLIFTVCVLAIFLFSTIVFIVYDVVVEVRQRHVMRNALSTGAIVSSLFPKAIQERLMAEQEKEKQKEKGKRTYMSNNRRLKSFLSGENPDQNDDVIDASALADLFPETTVAFADIENFTAWSSQRDPGQVFTLLQSIYSAFDKVAKRMKVFKVETVGDSYVAVTGLPVAQPNHAIIMVKFAQACLFKFAQITKRLEVALGPDTGELKLRVGLHSGPVTAGVLRGDKSRFQLFGDTVNTAARMESSGLANRIQISKATAEKLREAGKASWFQPRSDEVRLKGKGLVSTFLITKVRTANSIASFVPDTTETSSSGPTTKVTTGKKDRLVSWNTEILACRLREVVARRLVLKSRISKRFKGERLTLSLERANGNTCLDEVEQLISMPEFDPKMAAKEVDPQTVDLGSTVMSQLRSYVEMIANMYQDNPFHNFEHASHVTMSVNKLLTRIVAPDIHLEVDNKSAGGRHKIMMGLHDFTYGITSDPLTQFGIVLSALIHDVDHRGVSNTQLAIENPSLANLYKGKSLAEQNSIDLAWDALMMPDFTDLRNCIYTDAEELQRFRQTILRVVLATDIFDKDLNGLRKQRWEEAFAVKDNLTQKDVNVKATIVIEHLIQASDVSHTMQHWHVYQKWNERLFCEMTEAYRAGRMSTDPATFWYQGEIGFLENYVIPLAKKLKDCNVFGVSSDEYLSYALANKEEWEQKGQQIVAELVEKAQYSILEEDENDLDNSEEVSYDNLH